MSKRRWINRRMRRCGRLMIGKMDFGPMFRLKIHRSKRLQRHQKILSEFLDDLTATDFETLRVFMEWQCGPPLRTRREIQNMILRLRKMGTNHL